MILASSSVPIVRLAHACYISPQNVMFHQDGGLMRSEIADEGLLAFAAAVRSQMSEKGVTRKELSAALKIADGVIGKVLRGERVHNINARKIARHLNISMEGTASPVAATIPIPTGGYERDDVAHWEGAYLTVRVFFDGSPRLSTYRTVLSWNASQRRLDFEEQGRRDSAAIQHKGAVCRPATGGFLYLVCGEEGYARLTILSVNPRDGQRLKGMLITLAAPGGPQLIPAATPIVLLKEELVGSTAAPEIDIQTPIGAKLHKELLDAQSNFSKFISAS